MNYLDLDAPLPCDLCERLKELEFPQDYTPFWEASKIGKPTLEYERRSAAEAMDVPCCSAPTPLTVLAWLAVTRDIYITMEIIGTGAQRWACSSTDRRFRSPAALVRAIVEAL